jgi:hypothetical protein
LLRAAKEKNQKITRSQVKQWLRSQRTYTLHKPARKRFPRNRVIVGSIDQLWQVDLVDVQSIKKYNSGYNYILTVIDVLSKFAWAIPLKKKDGPSLVTEFKHILKSGRKPLKVQADKGTEFMNRLFQSLLKERNIEFFNTFNAETKASIVERLNKTLKSKLWTYFTWKNTLRYVDILPELINSYNNTYHRSIKTKPSLVNKSNEKEIWYTLYGKEPTRKGYKFRIGDQVRISKSKRLFDKGYLQSWNEEIFTIAKRIPRNPPVYKLKEYDGDEVEGTFYENELQRVVREENDLFRVEKVLKTRKRGKTTEHFLKWLGYPDKYNSWIPSGDLNKV